MQWYKIKEKSAGKFRLILSLYLYKIFGKKVLNIIAFFVSFFTFIGNRDLRKYSKNYFKILYEYTKNEKLKPTVINSFKHVLSYSYSLVDKIEAYLQNFKSENIEFFSEEDKIAYLNDINNKGVFVLCNHTGNIDILRSLFSSNKYPLKSNVSVFLQKNHCKIFNEFIDKFKINIEKIKICPVEEIDISSANILDEDLKKGGIAFMAGDRVSDNNVKCSDMDFLNKKIRLPEGAFRFAKIMDTNIYFVSALKEKNKYKIYLHKEESKNIKQIQKDFVDFLEKMTLLAPYQFYNFFDFFV